MKNLFKDIIFLIILILLFNICTNIFVLKGNGYGSDIISFYNLENDSLDAIFFGSSHSYATFSPDIIEAETGLKTYNFATQQQPIYITYHYMIEALKTQQPKYFILETKMLAVDDEYASEGVIRDAIDKMKNSLNKYEAIQVSVKNEEEKASYYFNIIKYHTRYNSLTKTDIITGLTYKGLDNRGFISLPSNKDIIVDNSEIIKISSQESLAEKNLKYLNKIIKLANDNDIKIIFVKSPCTLKVDEQKKYNWLKKYAQEKNISYIDYNYYFNELNLGIGDFYDNGHLSGTGAAKVSKAFAEYLKEFE